ncbi:MAG: hypothetical protein M3404_00060 [Actinomycetota bacterium]|nr:hypothetical protein [Actinomycetota bacterium]
MAVRNLLFVNTKNDLTLDGNAPAGNSQAATFVTIQSLLTFPVASAFVAILWNLLQTLFEGKDNWADSRIVPVIGSALIGLFIIAWTITDPKGPKSGRDRFGAIFIGLVNIVFLAAAAVGLDVTATAGLTGDTAS